MDRPTVLLAIDGDIESHVEALHRAGFAPVFASAGGVPADGGTSCFACALPIASATSFGM